MKPAAHQALHALRSELWGKRLYWVVDIDIRKYFDSIPHSHLRAFLDQRVTDGIIRMIDKWLGAGAVEDGVLRRTTERSPQGGVVSPCLSNFFCTMCWMIGSRPRYDRGSAGPAPWHGAQTTLSWHSTILSNANGSWQYWVSALNGLGLHFIPTRRASSTFARNGRSAIYGQRPFRSSAGCGE
ncbi:reverse transcriptase domain-containing protein [Rhizobium ruizarguesonis]|uniref:reverse transcriptase domain-containing protein n=1 Tax=Rhizobium ruizarguesonis TaxID=2081791 RepID=UPI001FDFEF77|nr:reverse transcriptase domain-containing protein [Rhizobium ruizarguesonis]